jgi:hypothetical protein
MTDRRRILNFAATSTRVVVGAAVAAAVVLAVILGAATPWSTVATSPGAVVATPAAADTVAACTGGLVALGRDTADVSRLAFAAPQAVVHESAGDDADTATLAPSPAIEGDDGADVYIGPAVDGERTDIAAAGSAQVDAPDLRGFAASACRAPMLESWLVGGATTTGSGDVVLLGNPGEVPATVTLAVYGVSGPQTPPGDGGIVVAPGTQKIVALAGIGVGEEAPVVRVTASGAPVTAALQSSITRTLLPGGVDQIGATAAASERIVIPGIAVTDTAVAAAEAGATTRVRLLSAQADTTATVTVTKVGGARVSTQDVPLTVGVPSEAGLSGLPEGDYTVSVEADAPVVAAAWQTTGFGEGADFAWYSATPEVSASTLVAVADGPAPTVVVTAGDEAAEIELEPLSGGDATTVEVAAGQSTSVSLDGGLVYRLSPTAPVHALVSYRGAGALAGVPVWPADADASALTVYP